MELTEMDDTLHAPSSDDIFWTETAWFAFAVPERRITACIYPVFRTNLDICTSGIYIWDDSSEAAHEILYGHNYWHLPLPEDLRHMELPSGLRYDVLEPLRRYRVRYQDGDEVEFDLTYEGLMAPYVPVEISDIQHLDDFHHLDQPCHVTGLLRLGGEEIPVDCYEMRDKSWSVRPDARNFFAGTMRVAYTYGSSPTLSFLAGTIAPNGGEGTMRAGYLLKDGEVAPLVSGSRRAERDRGRPSKVVVEGTDALGRTFHAAGRCVNRLAFQSTPGIFAWMSGTEWDVDGLSAWGEDQEMSTPQMRLAELRKAREQSANAMAT